MTASASFDGHVARSQEPVADGLHEVEDRVEVADLSATAKGRTSIE